MKRSFEPPALDPAIVDAQGGPADPAPLRGRVSGRTRRLGDAAGLKNSGANLVKLAPGSRRTAWKPAAVRRMIAPHIRMTAWRPRFKPAAISSPAKMAVLIEEIGA